MQSIPFPHHPSNPLPMRIAISIPKPCHEDWNAMTPDPGSEAGRAPRFCDSCQHSVADLTTASDAELVALFTSDAKPIDRTFFWRIDRSNRKQKAIRHGKWKYINDGNTMDLLFDLDMGVQGAAMTLGQGDATVVRLTGVYHNLLRRWADS